MNKALICYSVRKTNKDTVFFSNFQPSDDLFKGTFYDKINHVAKALG